MIPFAWHHLPATVHPYWIARLGNRNSYFTNCTLSRQDVLPCLRAGSLSVASWKKGLKFLCGVYFTDCVLTGGLALL